MAPVTGPGLGSTPSARGRSRRKVWLGGVVVAWLVVVAGLAVWSVGHQRPTVPEQRDIDQALPKLQEAAGVVSSAADGPGRAVTLGEVALAEGCRVTPVRSGVAATRDITIRVRDGQARATLEAIATDLPKEYQADVAVGRTQYSLHADAGNFIGIDADSRVDAREVTVRVSTGCRPHGSQASAPADPAAGNPPVVLQSVLQALGAEDKVPAVRAVECPDGKVAGTYEVDGIPAGADLPERLGFLRVTEVIRSDEDVRAYRTGSDSVVVAVNGQRVNVSVSTAC
jgi:hypothetical protein